ncbi:MAG TPA: hypothetical protein DDW30_02710 [Clostridiales bacterium]|nr:hypothetical protein [Clostridiales bacterium]
MKFLYAVREGFKGLVRRSPFVFFMICLGMLICNMMFTWFYGNMKYTLIHSGHTRITVEGLREIGLTDEDLLGLSDSAGVVRVSFHALDPHADDARTVTYDAPQTRGWALSSVEIELSCGENDVEAEALRSQLCEAFGNGVRVDAYENVRQTFLKDGLILVLIYLGSIFSVLFLMSDLCEESLTELRIYAMLGAGQGWLLGVLSAILSGVLLVVGALSQVLYAALYPALFVRFTGDGSFSYTALDHLIVTLGTALLVFAFLCGFAAYRIRGSCMEAYRRKL